MVQREGDAGNLRCVVRAEPEDAVGDVARVEPGLGLEGTEPFENRLDICQGRSGQVRTESLEEGVERFGSTLP